MIRLTILLLCLLAAGCGSNEKAYDSKAYPFDPQVIAKLPLYDSISRVLLQNFSALQEEIKEHASFDYSFSGTASVVNPKLPREAAEKIKAYQAQLGKDFLFEFSVYKDSTIKYSVRDTDVKDHNVTVRERLSYLPNGGTMQRRASPNKDTILNANWQYWIRFD
ncbi:MAG: hypothetical protein EOO10_13980 [Chitinophagaceae bacterium]|nr:MAG: hypothetical protein EOO10_13980 [Chitinophagaceae bacterium]